MQNQMIVHKQVYQVFIKGDPTPIEISWENGERLGNLINHKDCPKFIQIDGGYYNVYEISKLIPYQEKISPQRAEALAEHARIQAIINQKK